MTYAYEMYFDKETEEKIMNLARKVADAGISTKFLEWKTHPHITLGVFNDIDEEKCAAILERFVKAHKAAPAYLHSVSMFTDTKVVYLSPNLNRGLFDLQRELYEMMDEFHSHWWEMYKHDIWALTAPLL